MHQTHQDHPSIGLVRELQDAELQHRFRHQIVQSIWQRHAYLDSGHNKLLGVSFADNAPPALDVMLEFLDGVFYPTNN